MKRWIVACAALCAFAAGAPREDATANVVALTVADLAHGAPLVIRGAVIGKEAQWTNDGNMIETTVTIECSESLKGGQAGALIHVKVPGGDIGALKIRSSEAPSFTLGEDVVLFARPLADRNFVETYGCFQGKLTILNGMVREFLNTTYDDLRTQILTAK